MNKKFYRNKEDFVCEICKTHVVGNGYTNHCNRCFSSKHVDINPGDRASPCRGIMKPIAYETHTKKGIVITHQCQKCHMIKKNKMSQEEDIARLIVVISELSPNTLLA